MHTNWIPDEVTLKGDTIHFAFDSSAIRSADKSKLAAVADYLKSHSEAAVRVEGNCDERGSAMYNLALGEKRASSAQQALTQGGAAAGQLKSVSYGKEKPVCSDANEDCWQKNRHDHFVLVSH